MSTMKEFKNKLDYFDQNFYYFAQPKDKNSEDWEKLDSVINDYSVFIVNSSNTFYWTSFSNDIDHQLFIERIRQNASQCVALMEKYRARRFLQSHTKIADYFENIESCIANEFSNFEVTPSSKVLLVGSGSFPMTPLLIAKKTGASVIGIDIDQEAIQLGKKVVQKLGEGLNIELTNQSVEEIKKIQEITHIIFSSTVSCKYDILNQLHDITNEAVIIAMRYGNDLKSLFNYPMKKVDDTKWQLLDQLFNKNHIFDVALYKKA